MRLKDFDEVIAEDKWGLFTVLALCSAISMFLNSITLSSSFLGILLTSIYILINSVSLGSIFFHEESKAFRTTFGFLVTVMFIALGGAAIIIASGFFPIKFDIYTTVGVMTLITIMTSLANHLQRRMKSKSKTNSS